MITLLISSFLAGVLTILAPCVLPVLPVVLAGSLSEKQKWYPYIVTLSLAISIVLFTILLKATTLFIDIPSSFWKYVSGGILLVLGLIYIFPHAWSWVATRLGFGRANISLDKTQDIGSPLLRAIATGTALGPVFSTCSPTYSLLLATVFPVSFISGIGYTLVYALGLALMLTIIAIGGMSIIAKFRGIADERGWFKRILGVVFVLIGLAIITGIDKKLEARALDIWNPSSLEEGLLDTLMPRKESMQSDNVALITTSTIPTSSPLISEEIPQEKKEIKQDASVVEKSPIEKKEVTPIPVVEIPVTSKPQTIPKPILPIPDFSLSTPYSAPEFTGLSNWIGSSPLTLASLRGKVVLIDFWTFGCSNCQATTPYIKALYEKYKNQGFIVIGVHAPEFSYEQKYENVLSAVKKAGITYPIALDNDFSTWRAYENQYWPALYFIDKKGKIRHTHFGEGDYQKHDDVVKYLLAE